MTTCWTTFATTVFNMSDLTQRENSSSNSLQRALMLMDLERYRDAIPLLSQILSDDPEQSFVLCQLAMAYFYLDDLDTAQKYCKDAIALQPDDGFAHTCYARILMLRKDFAGALQHARHAVSIDPDMSLYLYILAWAEYQNGHYKQAYTAAQQALQGDPDNAHLHQLMGNLTLVIEKPGNAEEHFLHALKHDPENADIHSDLGNVYAQQHDLIRASESYLRAIRLRPDSSDYREQLFALLHHDAGRLNKSQRKTLLDSLDPAVHMFYTDELTRRSWAQRMRLGSVVSIWLMMLLLLTWIMSLLTGSSSGGLIKLIIMCAFVYLVMYLANKWFARKYSRIATGLKESNTD